MSRILLLTVEPILAKGVAAVLSSVAEFDLVAVCYTPARLLEAISPNEPDLLLIDITAGVPYNYILELRQRQLRCKIVLWTHSIAPEIAYHMIRLGVRGILPKTLTAETLVKCLQRIAEGECWFDEALTSSFLTARTISLTRRESQLVALIAQGLKNKEIASQLSISQNSVKVYLSKLFRKVGAKDRYSLALFALKNMMPAESSSPNGAGDTAVTLLNGFVPGLPVKPAANVGPLAAGHLLA